MSMTGWNKYGPTAARSHGRRGPQVRPKSVTVDVHSHVAVLRAAELVKPYLATAANPLAAFADAATRALNQKQEADIAAGSSLAQRLGDLDAMGIDVQVIKPPPPQCTFAVPPDIAVEAARMVNDGIAEFVAQRPDRLKGFGTVPMPDGSEAAKELERCATELGFKGVQILTNVNGRELSDPAFAPFWRKAEELGMLVVIHPNGFTEASRLSRFYFNNVIGNPLETTIALHYLIFDGVLERHPNLKISGRARRRLSRQLRRTHRSRLGRAVGQPRRSSAGPYHLSAAALFRYRRVHARPAARAGAPLRRRSHPDGNGLSLRHGRVRSGGPRLRGGIRRRDDRSHLRRQCEPAAGAIGRNRAIAVLRRSSRERSVQCAFGLLHPTL